MKGPFDLQSILMHFEICWIYMHTEYTFVTIRNRFQAGVTKFNQAYMIYLAPLP